jgi:hypothetical protein
MDEEQKLEAFKNEMATFRRMINGYISTNPALAGLELDSLILKEKGLSVNALSSFTSDNVVICCDGNGEPVYRNGSVCTPPYRPWPC